MDFRKIKRLHNETKLELYRLSKTLSDKFDREINITFTSDGICVMFEDKGMTGISLEEFEALSKQKGFDTRQIETYL
jgi:hypothetical protein